MIAGWGDLTFDLYGYFLTAVNCFVTAAYLVLIAQKSQQTGLQTFGLMFYNNILSLPFMTVLMLTDWKFLKGFDKWFDIGFLVSKQLLVLFFSFSLSLSVFHSK
jgi:hypothetical protein